MTIDLSQLHPIFRPATIAEKKEQDKLKQWKAVFYTIRALAWKDACRELRKNGLETGVLVYQDGEVRTEDGADIKEYFNEFREDFDDAFDRAFVKATIDEMVAYAEKHFGLSYEQIMQLNDERMAALRGRTSTKPYHQKPTVDPIAQEQKRKKK